MNLSSYADYIAESLLNFDFETKLASRSRGAAHTAHTRLGPDMKFSIYLAAFLPWGVLAPLNVIKLMLNAVSPTAHFWVPKETEQCQGACGIARMWAQLFWSLQFISALSFVYVHYHREQTGLVHMGIATKLVVGLLLLKAYLSGVIHWPIGLGGPCLDWALALGFALELRSRDALASPKPMPLRPKVS